MVSELESAVERDDLPRVQRLLAEGRARINDADRDGYTTLLDAALYGHLTMLQWLLREGGASITEANFDGNTALLLAAQNVDLKSSSGC
jgi:ankyrin repeat protein